MNYQVGLLFNKENVFNGCKFKETKEEYNIPIAVYKKIVADIN